MRKYDDLMGSLIDSGARGIAHACKLLGYAERVNFFRQVTMDAVRAHDDDVAGGSLTYLIRAIQDQVFFQHDLPIGSEDNGFTLNDSTPEKRERIREVEEETQRQWAREAVSLWEQLPLFRMCTPNEVRFPGAVPTLLGTKTTLIKMIALRWSSSKDDAEATQLIKFLASIKSS
ncbi:MAG TPA: hypothetical protein VJJ22_01145 [Candidatus Paceibacterota bacterium]